MNLISKIVVGTVIFNLIAVTVIAYKVMKPNNLNDDKLKSMANSSTYKANTYKVETKNILNRYKKDNINKLYGIDVSHWNGNLIQDLPKNSKVKFVICKSTQGEKDVDPDFFKNWKFLSEKNIIKGTYHFYMYPQDPLKQADHFCKTVRGLNNTDLPLIIDIEEMSLPRAYIDVRKLKNDLLKFLNFIENKTKRTPVIYSDYSFINQYLNDPVFSKYPLWLAEYSHSLKPKIPNVWKKEGCMIWQKTDSYRIDATEADYDIFYR